MYSLFSALVASRNMLSSSSASSSSSETLCTCERSLIARVGFVHGESEPGTMSQKYSFGDRVPGLGFWVSGNQGFRLEWSRAEE